MATNDSCPVPQAWIVEIFDDCLLSTRDYVGFAIGLFSTCCWMVAQLPQIFKNYRLQSAEGLSPFFLVIWFLGDFSNLGGCLLGNLVSDTSVCLSTQTIQGIYFIIIDVILCTQWVMYTNLRRSATSSSSSTTIQLPPPDDEDPLIEDATSGLELTSMNSPDAGVAEQSANDEANWTNKPTQVLMILPLLALSFLTVGHLLTFPSSSTFNSPSQRVLLEESGGSNANTLGVILSQVVAWTSTVMYLACRIPQILRNWQRGTTEGLAILMFASAMVANATYSSSVFIRLESLAQLWPRLPWIIGSAGVLFFDTIICIQHVYYKSKQKRRQSVDISEES